MTGSQSMVVTLRLLLPYGTTNGRLLPTVTPQILEVGKTVDAGSITKAYRKLAKKKHPDKGGDPEEFKALAEAYEVRRFGRCFRGFVRYT